MEMYSSGLISFNNCCAKYCLYSCRTIQLLLFFVLAKNMNILLLCNMCNSCLILLIVAVAHLWPGDLLLKKDSTERKRLAG